MSDKILFERSLEGGNIRRTGNGRRQGIPGFGTLGKNCKLLNFGSTRVRPTIRSISPIMTKDFQISLEKMLKIIWKQLIVVGIRV